MMDRVAFALPVRRAGRPVASLDPAQRRRHIECAGLYYGTDWTLERVARACGIAVPTVYLWVDAAVGYSDPEAEGLRRAAANSRRRFRPTG